MSEVRQSVAALRGLVADAMAACGLPAADAATVGRLMVEADLAGADAHGIFRLPAAVRRIRDGGINPRPAVRVERNGDSVARIDGDNGMGHVVMDRATELAAELARGTGIGWVGVHRSNHAGAAGTYPGLLAEQGLIGIYSAVASANHMAFPGGAEALLGTNPLAIAVPCGDKPPVLLDIATTVVSYGTVKAYALDGRPMPEGWMVDRRTGAPITDARNRGDGVLLPFGGYKGSGLALILGLLAGTLNGAAMGRDVVDFNADTTTPTNTGQFVLALDPGRFLPPELFAAEVARHLNDFRAGETVPGAPPIRIPGDERARRRADRLARGVALPGELVGQLDRLASDLEIAPLGARATREEPSA